jgi:hypothetical protein
MCECEVQHYTFTINPRRSTFAWAVDCFWQKTTQLQLVLCLSIISLAVLHLDIHTYMFGLFGKLQSNMRTGPVQTWFTSAYSLYRRGHTPVYPKSTKCSIILGEGFICWSGLVGAGNAKVCNMITLLYDVIIENCNRFGGKATAQSWALWVHAAELEHVS